MVVRIRKHLYLKPRHCPDCGKICLFCRCYKAERCGDCHKRKRDRVRRRLRRYVARHADNYKYDKSYWRRRRRILKEHPYCALCGATENLTTHHVGGGDEHLTVLCDECHQAYEKYNNKRKDKGCIRKIGISASIRRLKRAVIGGNLLIWRIRMKSKSLNEKLENSNQFCTLPAQRWSLEKEENETKK